MSRSNITEVNNPAKRFFEWSGSKGCFEYYNKETKEKVEVPLPFRFLVLDTLSTIKGYSESEGSGFWSNEIRDIKKETLTVRTKKGIETKGFYEEIKDKIKVAGAKYTQSVYIVYVDEDKQPQIGNINMGGSALAGGALKSNPKENVGGWMDFRKQAKGDLLKMAVEVREAVECKKGSNTYLVPVFTLSPVAEAANQLAIEKDVELQEYLTAYFALKPSEETAPTTSRSESIDNGPTPEYAEAMTVTATPGDEDDLPF